MGTLSLRTKLSELCLEEGLPSDPGEDIGSLFLCLDIEGANPFEVDILVDEVSIYADMPKTAQIEHGSKKTS